MKKLAKKPKPRKMKPAEMLVLVPPKEWLATIHATKGEAISWTSEDGRVVKIEIRENII